MQKWATAYFFICYHLEMQAAKRLYATEKLWTGSPFSSVVSSVKTPLEYLCAYINYNLGISND
jgi:hypothetical protein